MIDEAGLHPITSLKSLSKKEKQWIVEQGVVLCREITRELLLKSNIRISKIDKIIAEAKILTEI